jgi:predicted nuclease of predicted toxin-antitoxin system
MAGARPPIPFFTDQNVPDSVGDVLVSAGHQLTRLRDVMDIRSPDPVIAVACSRHGQVLVSHDTDFRDISRRLGLTQRQYRTSLHRIHLRCPEPMSAQRIKEALSLIEAEWLLIVPDRPMVIEIRSASIVTQR